MSKEISGFDWQCANVIKSKASSLSSQGLAGLISNPTGLLVQTLATPYTAVRRLNIGLLQGLVWKWCKIIFFVCAIVIFGHWGSSSIQKTNNCKQYDFAAWWKLHDHSTNGQIHSGSGWESEEESVLMVSETHHPYLLNYQRQSGHFKRSLLLLGHTTWMALNFDGIECNQAACLQEAQR